MDEQGTKAFRQYLVHSYLYYVQDCPLIPDAEYDEICKNLLEALKRGYVPENCGYVSEESLQAGTGFHIPADRYPGIVVSISQDRLFKAKKKWKPHDIYPHSYCKCGCRGAFLPKETL